MRRIQVITVVRRVHRRSKATAPAAGPVRQPRAQSVGSNGLEPDGQSVGETRTDRRRGEMKRALVLLVALGLTALPAFAQPSEGINQMTLEISGSVATLGNPLAGPFSVIATYAGKGQPGRITGQGLYLYRQLGSQGEMVCDAGQSAVRMGATGDMLLLLVTPGPTGAMVPNGDGTFTWTQTFKGTLGGGTGRFAGATGTFTKTLTGRLVLPGLVSPWTGTLEIHIDPK